MHDNVHLEHQLTVVTVIDLHLADSCDVSEGQDRLRVEVGRWVGVTVVGEVGGCDSGRGEGVKG